MDFKITFVKYCTIQKFKTLVKFLNTRYDILLIRLPYDVPCADPENFPGRGGGSHGFGSGGPSDILKFGNFIM